MDEPFSGLDAMLREELVPQVAAVLKREGMAAILVTHDQNEAFAMADRIVEGDFLDATVMDNETIFSSLGDLRGL